MRKNNGSPLPVPMVMYPSTAIVRTVGHCAGVWVGKRAVPTPQNQALTDVRSGKASDDNLMNAAMMFNSLIRDGSAIECSDDENRGFANLY